MKLEWLEDLIALIDARTFSRAAEVRNVTQPAFSRRIQMLENWLGVQLVNRHTRRSQIADTTAEFEPELRRLVAHTYEIRSRMRADARRERQVSITAQHTLMVSHLPALLRLLRESQVEATFRVRTGNLEECASQLARGDADLLLCFETAGVPTELRYTPELERLAIGSERLVPVTACDHLGQPLHNPHTAESLPLLRYPDESFLGRVVRDQCLVALVRSHTMEIVCESAFTMGLKEMALSGMGIAWLPQALIASELEQGVLLALHDSLSSPNLTIALYRLEGNAPNLHAIWPVLQCRAPIDDACADN